MQNYINDELERVPVSAALIANRSLLDLIIKIGIAVLCAYFLRTRDNQGTTGTAEKLHPMMVLCHNLFS